MNTNAAATTATDQGGATRLTAFHPLPRVGIDAVRAALTSDPGVWLPEPAAPAPDGWVTRLHAGPVSHSALCVVGDPWADGEQTWRPIAWQPADSHGRVRPHHGALPAFQGDIGLVVNPAPTLVITGTYEPPGGVMGAAADRLLLERVANATARRWLVDAATRLVAQASAQEPAHP
jgi:hypothetical protein